MAVNLTKLIDLDLLSYFKSKLDLLFATKVDKVEGKGLSTNDYTADEKAKLANIASGAQVNVLEGIQKNGTTVTITNKIANISVPTKLSDLNNDGNFVTDSSYVHTDNNYTTTEKNKLSGVANGAQVNVIETVKVNGTAQTVTSKAVNITVPTKIGDLTNDGNYVTDASYVHTDANFTEAEKTKLGTVATNAQVNVIETIKVNNTAQTVTGKAVNISVPTKLTDLTNDGNFVTDASYSHIDNNYTDAEKSKLAAIASNAQVNVIETIKVNGAAQTVTSKAVNITVPTQLSALENNAGFITIADVPEGAAATTTTPKMDGTAAVGSELAFARGDHVHPIDTSRAPLASPTFTGTPNAPTASSGTNTTQIATCAFVNTAVSVKADASTVYTKSEIDSKLAGAMNYKGTKATVAALPSTGNATGDVWHVTADGGEYAWNGTAWEELGSVIDLSGYVEDSDLGLATTAEIDALFTGE